MSGTPLSGPPACAFCGRQMLRWLEDYWGTRFCPEHRDHYPGCQFCGRLVKSSGIPQAQAIATAVCPVCATSAVGDLDRARPLFAELVQWVNAQGLKFNNLDLRIELRNRAQLAAFALAPGDKRCFGATLCARQTWNGRLYRSGVEGVAILKGLPATLFCGVTIHELGHAWLAVHGVTELTALNEEGFCDFLAYRYYSGLGTREGQFWADITAQNPDPTYGGGLRRIRAVTEVIGFPQVLARLLSASRLESN